MKKTKRNKKLPRSKWRDAGIGDLMNNGQLTHDRGDEYMEDVISGKIPFEVARDDYQARLRADQLIMAALSPSEWLAEHSPGGLPQSRGRSTPFNRSNS